jgi:hypothetical protein
LAHSDPVTNPTLQLDRRLLRLTPPSRVETGSGHVHAEIPVDGVRDPTLT